MKPRKITLSTLWSEFPRAYEALRKLCASTAESDYPLALKDFNYYSLEPSDGSVIAEVVQVGGPREPGYIWSAAIHGDKARWFCSEDGDDEEIALGWRLSKLCPGGIGGF